MSQGLRDGEVDAGYRVRAADLFAPTSLRAGVAGALVGQNQRLIMVDSE